MPFRLKALGLHLLASAGVLTLVLGCLYLGWYRWPGWYLANVSTVMLVLAVVDLGLGPLLTSIVASPGKPRRELRRDISIIAAIQLLALGYGTVSLWNGRPLYYAFSENVLQLVQAYDIGRPEWVLGARVNPALAPRWYSLPRWIWAPLPDDPELRNQIIVSALTGGIDVISMPQYFKPWADGTSALRAQLKTPAELSRFYSGADLQSFLVRMRRMGLATDQANAMAFLGRGKRMLAVFDPSSVKLVALLDAPMQ